MAAEQRIRGPLDVEAMRAALQHVVMGNEILRTTFIERDGQPLQVIGAPGPIEIPLIDLGDEADADAGVTAILRRDALEPFDLERGPLVRLRIVRVGDDDHRLLRLIHHIVADGVSWRPFLAEVARGYEAHRRGEPMPTIPDSPQYADFAVWERERLRPDGELYREQVDWWRRAFELEWPPVRLPFARPTPVPDAPEKDGVIYWGIEPGEAAALDRLARRSGATPYAVRLALFTALLGLETGQEEITVGTYAMNRPGPETQSMFGFFSNPVTLLLNFDPKLSFRRWLRRVRQAVIDVKARSEVPHERLFEELHPGATPPEIKAMFVLRTRWPLVSFAGLEIGPPRLTIVGMPWGFSFNVDPNRESEWCMAMFDARIHDPEGVRDFIERYRQLVRGVLEKPRRRLRRLRS